MSDEIVILPFQLDGIEWLAKQRHAILADEMGAGKSAQTILAADRIGAKRVCVLCPAVARINWEREFQKFSSRAWEFDIVDSKSTTLSPHKSIICSYDLAAELYPTFHGPFDVLILDESHYLKSTAAKRTAAALGRQGLVHESKRTWAISGTPAPNNVSELWPLLYTFGATRLSFDSFVEKFCTYYIHNNRRCISGTKKSAIPELRQILKPFILRRLKKDVMKELPPISYEDFTVEPGDVDMEMTKDMFEYVFPTDRTSELYEKVRREAALAEEVLTTVRTGRDGMMALEAMAKSLSTLRKYSGLQKVNPVADIISSELLCGAYDKIVLFAHHRDVIEGLRARLADFGAVTVYGGSNPTQKQKNIDAFMKNPKCQVFIGNIAAAGTNITLTSAHQVAFVECDYVPGNNAQAAMRCHRIGQEFPVFVRFFSLTNSIDHKITQAFRRKTKELVEVFDR